MDAVTVWEEPSRSYVRIFSDRVYLDVLTRRWACTCGMYGRLGKCGHMRRFRVQRTVNVSEEYL
jgi:hypothetical protein